VSIMSRKPKQRTAISPISLKNNGIQSMSEGMTWVQMIE
jgi:hypothetical protein